MSIKDTETWSTQRWLFQHISIKQDAKIPSVNNWLKILYYGLYLKYGEYGEIQKIFH